jgi:hypothetical protein
MSPNQEEKQLNKLLMWKNHKNHLQITPNLSGHRKIKKTHQNTPRIAIVSTDHSDSFELSKSELA